MTRRRLALLAGGGLALAAALLRSTSPAGAAAEPTPPSARDRALPTRLTAAPAAAPAPECCALSLHLRLGVGERLDLGTGGTLFPAYAPDQAWPLPDELPAAALDSDPVVWSLQELLGADDDDREAILDDLDHALDTRPASASPWSALARIEAERQLEQADHEAALADHTAALQHWAEQGGRGPLPPTPAPRQTADLAAEAQDLAASLPDGEAAQLARLTAAALLTDWEGEHFDENGAAELLVDVMLDAEQPHLLAAATDLLVGLDVDHAPEELDLLEDIGPELGPEGRLRLEWFLTQQRAAHGAPEQARRHLEQARQAAAELGTPDAESERLHAALDRARGPLLARTGGTPAGWEEAVLAAAQDCADQHPPAHEELRLALTPAGLHALVGDGPVGRCLRGALGSEAGPEGGVEITLELVPQGG